jgi:hypothetical protein
VLVEQEGQNHAEIKLNDASVEINHMVVDDQRVYRSCFSSSWTTPGQWRKVSVCSPHRRNMPALQERNSVGFGTLQKN